MITIKNSEMLIYTTVSRGAYKRGIVASRLPLLRKNPRLNAVNPRFRNINDKLSKFTDIALRPEVLANKRNFSKINFKSVLLYLADSVGEGVKQYFLGNDINMEYMVLCLRAFLIWFISFLSIQNKLSVQEVTRLQ